jgi:hypothetical protein
MAQSPGRITGTVIELNSGAPAPGVAVAVGDVVVTSDANGNYDRSDLPPRSYLVALLLKEGQGIPVQEPVLVNLTSGSTVIQHLTFRIQPIAKSSPAAVGAPVRLAALPMTGLQDSDMQLWLVLGIGLIISGMGLRRLVQRKSGDS